MRAATMKPIRKRDIPAAGVPAWTTLLLLLTAAACGDREAATPAAGGPAAGEPPAAVRVETAVATVSTVADHTRASGSVAPLRRVRPGTKILGRIDRVLVSEGERVKSGQVLARLESRDLEAAVAQAAAAVRMAEAQVENAAAQLERIRELHGRGSVTEKNLEDAVAGERVAAAGLAQAEANRAAAEVTLGYAEIKSPIAGWVVAKHVEAGDMAAPGVPFFTLEDLSRVKVEVEVPEAELQGIAAGAPARVEILDREIAAAVDRIVPAGDPRSRTFLAQILLDNPDGALMSGMFARVSFPGGERRALLVPATAVVDRGQLRGLYVVEEETGAGAGTARARLRWLRVGRPVGDELEILSGLEAGERYLVEPPAGLADGAAVEVGS